MNSTRKRFQEDLEAREKQAAAATTRDGSKVSGGKKMKREDLINLLREENARILEEERERVRLMENSRTSAPTAEPATKPSSVGSDFETLVFMRMRKAEERRRLAEPTSTSAESFEADSKHRPSPDRSSTNTGTDFENLVLRRMRQADERRRLAEQMAAEDD